MIMMVHVRQVTLWHGDYPVRWEEVAFDPLPAEREERPSGVLVERSASAPIRVQVPAGSQVRDGRLVCHCARLGWDASTVLHVARRGINGCRVEPDAPPPRPTTWAIAFRSTALPECRSYAARDPELGRIESTCDPCRIRTWPDPESAAGWLHKVGLSERDPVPIGSPGWLRPVIELLDPETLRGVDWARGVEWSIREPGEPHGPRWYQLGAEETPKPAPRTGRAVQLSLFGEVLGGAP